MKAQSVFFLLFNAASAAILAIDYGTEWTKAALVKPGIPLEIVLTKDTKRKEQSVIAFKGEERLYGQDAANMVGLSKHQNSTRLTSAGIPFPSLYLSSLEKALRGTI